MNDELQQLALIDLLAEFLDGTEGQPSVKRAVLILAIIDKAKTMYKDYTPTQEVQSD